MKNFLMILFFGCVATSYYHKLIEDRSLVENLMKRSPHKFKKIVTGKGYVGSPNYLHADQS
ncbi:MAG: hypothetical protein QM734_00300 [Cyclobacteriaceae bacterium]